MKAVVTRSVLLILIAVLFIAGCGKPGKTTESPNTDSAEAESPESPDTADNRPIPAAIQEGSLIYLSGDVEWSAADKDAWLPAEIGQIVRTGDSVRTFSDAWCELKFSERSVVRLQENTLFEINQIYDEENDAAGLRGRITRGTIAAKVRKLAGNESLEISTPTVACAVRGTVFLISADDTETTIAVSEGSVAVIPGELDLDKRRSQAAGDTVDSLEIVEAALPLVNAGDEIVLGAREQNELSAGVEEIAAILDSSDPDPQKLAAATQSMARAIGIGSELSEKSRVILEPLEREDLGAELEQTEISRVTVTWNLTPGDAELLVNETIRGRGTVSGTWTEGDQLTVRAYRPGYREFESAFTAELTQGASVIEISLEKLPTRYFDLYAAPEGSSIIVDGDDKGPVYKGAVSWEERSHIRVLGEDYNEQRFLVSYEEAPEGRIDIPLKRTVESVLPTISAKIVGLEVEGNEVILAYEDGTVLAINAGGVRQWKYTSTNSPNENARPHIIDNKVFFSGINEFVILDAVSGSKIHSTSQSPNTTHMLGRRSVQFGDVAAYPATDAILLINPNNGNETQRIPLPSPGQMTPMVVDGNIYTVLADGTFLGFNPSGDNILRISTPANKPIGHAPIISDNIVFFGDRDGFVHALDLNRKQYLWKARTGKAVQDELAVAGPYLVVYSNHDVFVLSAVNGTIHLPPIRGFSAAPLVSGGFLYGGLESGELIAVNIFTGEEVSRVSINGQVSSNGVELPETVAFGTDRGDIYITNKQDPSMLDIPPEAEGIR